MTLIKGMCNLLMPFGMFRHTIRRPQAHGTNENVHLRTNHLDIKIDFIFWTFFIPNKPDSSKSLLSDLSDPRLIFQLIQTKRKRDVSNS